MSKKFESANGEFLDTSSDVPFEWKDSEGRRIYKLQIMSNQGESVLERAISAITSASEDLENGREYLPEQLHIDKMARIHTVESDADAESEILGLYDACVRFVEAYEDR